MTLFRSVQRSSSGVTRGAIYITVLVTTPLTLTKVVLPFFINVVKSNSLAHYVILTIIDANANRNRIILTDSRYPHFLIIVKYKIILVLMKLTNCHDVFKVNLKRKCVMEIEILVGVGEVG